MRIATEADCNRFWFWVNEKETRKSAFNSQPISWNDHRKWFQGKIADDSCCIYVCMNEKDHPIGQVRFDIMSDERAVVDVSIGKNWRGHGYATSAIEVASRQLFFEKPIEHIDAEIKADNEASIRVFAKAGFKFLCEENISGHKAVRMRLSRHHE